MPPMGEKGAFGDDGSLGVGASVALPNVAAKGLDPCAAAEGVSPCGKIMARLDHDCGLRC